MSGFKDGYEPTQADLDNHANQLNPNNDLYQGDDDGDDDEQKRSQADLDNHANQLNQNNEAYHSSRR